ncbi:MAG: hypothetical protein QOI91_761 [Solirubrobacteraceae bacterium]|nr:hypothetical protein [Solirubrobacteraceae bacterium]
MADVTCPNCEHQVPEGTWCVRCGYPLDGAGRRRPGGGFAAAPHQRAGLPRLVSTLFPALPRADMDAFRIALVIGVAGVLALAAARLFPVAVLAAALLVPLLVVVYLYDVDVYEDQPFRVVAFTLAWGAVAGVAMGLLAQEVTTVGPDLALDSHDPDVLLRGVLLPLAGVALMLAGPLVLLPYRRFNDILDGATFGAASGVAFTAAQAVTLAAPLLEGGLRPDGEVLPWMARTFTLAVGGPVLAMAAIGAAAAAFWLRYRGPAADRRSLGPLGHPVVAVGLAAGLIVLGAVGQPLLPVGWWVVELTVLDALALLWLRRTLHLGLLQEASEIAIGPEIECPNCGARTARHSFCSNCGVALAALPKRPPVGEEGESGGTPPASGEGGSE